jgi:hypothetical protein
MCYTWVNNYRIKTEQEFINEFGIEYYNNIDWVYSMNFLFGKKLNELELIIDISEKEFLSSINYYILALPFGYHINSIMVKNIIESRKEKLMTVSSKK